MVECLPVDPVTRVQFPAGVDLNIFALRHKGLSRTRVFVNLHCIDLVAHMLFGPQKEKTCLQGLQSTLAQTSLCIHKVLSVLMLSLIGKYHI